MEEHEESAVTTDESDDRAKSELSITQTKIESYRGPLPQPAAIQAYEEILPGAADRIFTMAENEAKHRHEIESVSMELSSFELRSAYQRSNRGLLLGAIVAIVIVAGGAYMAYLGEPAVGGGVIGGTIVGLAGTFVYGARMRGRENESDN